MTTLTAPRYSRDDWWADAACRNKPWVGEAMTKPTIEAAKRVCGTCPVIEDCRRQALALEARLPRTFRMGVAGGMSKAERYDAGKTSCQACGTTVPSGHTFCEEDKKLRIRESARRAHLRRREREGRA